MSGGPEIDPEDDPADALDPRVARLWYLAVLTAPWSVEVPLGVVGCRAAVPQEPLLVFVAALALRIHGISGLRRLIAPAAHPVVLLAAAGLAWTAIAAVASAAPAVSAKVLVVRGGQAAVYLLLGLAVVRSPADARRVALVGACGLAPVAIWALVRAQLLEGWQAVHASAMPFFHSRLELTVMAAFWALAVLGLGRADRPRWSVGPALVLLVSVVALRGRSAAVGLVAGAGMWLLGRTRVRSAPLAAAAVLAAVVAGALAVDYSLWRGSRGDPGRPVTVFEPLWTVVEAHGPSSDASIAERFNRWRCCFLMAADRPLTGFGPGTFEREYGPYQRDRDRTRWSTDVGNLGDAHSEPLGRLAEEGVFGLVLQLALIGSILWTAFRVATSSAAPEVAGTARAWLGAVGGLAAAGLFVCLSDLSGTGFSIWLAAAVVVRLDCS